MKKLNLTGLTLQFLNINKASRLFNSYDKQNRINVTDSCSSIIAKGQYYGFQKSLFPLMLFTKEISNKVYVQLNKLNGINKIYLQFPCWFCQICTSSLCIYYKTKLCCLCHLWAPTVQCVSLCERQSRKSKGDLKGAKGTKQATKAHAGKLNLQVSLVPKNKLTFILKILED